jgi:hypothetical protein
METADQAAQAASPGVSATIISLFFDCIFRKKEREKKMN